MSDFLDEWQAWRDAREERLRDPRGWLAITAIHWLTATPQRFDDVPGEWYGEENRATVRLGREETLTAGRTILTEGVHQLGPLDESGLTVGFDDAVAQVASRGGRAIVRPRHPDSPNLRAYHATPCYPPDPGWILRGRFESYPAADGEAVGEIVFEYRGTEHRLIAWAEEDGRLWILFRDATSGITTYPASRQVLTAPPSPDGIVFVDFNRAMNMPCAYTDFATCPLPPAANALPFAVEAGEQLPAVISPRA